MSVSQASTLFANYTKVEPKLPKAFWWVLRVATFIGTVALAAMLLFDKQLHLNGLGLRLWWKFAIPILPAFLVVMPGLWRQVCPMALANQTPREFGFSRMKTLPKWASDNAFGVATLFFFLMVALRAPILNENSLVLGIAVVAVLIIPFVGGVVFKGRSGWCGTFCPLGPIQRDYGMAPLVNIRNGYCETCVGCQKNCYDFNPRAAIFGDMSDPDLRYASQRRFFMAMMPGMILGYFLQDPKAPYGEPTHFLIMVAATYASVGLFQMTTGFFGVKQFRAANYFAAIALTLFYMFSLANIVGTVGFLIGADPKFINSLPLASMGVGLGLFLGVIVILQGHSNENTFEGASRFSDQVKVDQSSKSLRERLAGSTKALVTDKGTGSAIPVGDGQTMLEAFEGARVDIPFGCRSGVCGADAVVICSGAENLSPPSDDEIATLRRMGLEGVGRLACVCRVKGEVEIDRDLRNAKKYAAADAGKAPEPDPLPSAGFKRVVIVGNGAAGAGVADGLRRASPSAEIVMISDEPYHFYNRMAIGRMIHGHSGMDGLFLLPDDWYRENKIEVWRNTVAYSIDREKRQLILATGDRVPYDRLVLATGADSPAPHPDFSRYPNTFVLRRADDALAIRNSFQRGGARKAVVVGGGVLGIEAADALNQLGMRVVVIQRAKRLMDRQLDEQGSQRLEKYLAGVGIEVITGASIEGVEGTHRLQRLLLAGGDKVEGDVFIACVGATPRIALAHAAGLKTGRGIVVDERMRTSDPHIYAVGDAAEHNGVSMGLWLIATSQAETAVADILGKSMPYKLPRTTVQLKCDGVDLKSFGEIEPKQGDETHCSAPEEVGWWRVNLRGGQVVGALYVGPAGGSRDLGPIFTGSGDVQAAINAIRNARKRHTREMQLQRA
jgi:nitrite reductase (NADH) large subunit